MKRRLVKIIADILPARCQERRKQVQAPDLFVEYIQRGSPVILLELNKADDAGVNIRYASLYPLRLK